MSDEGFVEVEGGRVWYSRVGSGDGLPLLAVHGGPGAGHLALTPLATLGARPIVFYDQLGCGRSERCTNDSLLRLERFVDEIDRVRDALCLDEFHLMGQSWGGAVAAAYAIRRRPGLRSVILSSPLISTARWAEDARRLKAELPSDVLDQLERHERDGYTGCLEYKAAMLVFYKRHLCRMEPWPDVLERSFAEAAHDVYDKMWGPSEFHPTGSLLDLDLSAELPSIEVPALFVCGEHDEATPRTVEGFARAVPGARFEAIEDASHTPLLERPNEYLDLLGGFLESVES